MAARKKKLTSAENTARLIAKLAAEKKADNIVILDMRKLTSFCDYFVICGATSDRRVKAVADGIREGLRQAAIKVWRSEGEREALWVLLDVGEIIVNVFEEKTRDFYNLEYLWRDAPRIE